MINHFIEFRFLWIVYFKSNVAVVCEYKLLQETLSNEELYFYCHVFCFTSLIRRVTAPPGAQRRIYIWQRNCSLFLIKKCLWKRWIAPKIWTPAIHAYVCYSVCSWYFHEAFFFIRITLQDFLFCALAAVFRRINPTHLIWSPLCLYIYLFANTLVQALLWLFDVLLKCLRFCVGYVCVSDVTTHYEAALVKEKCNDWLSCMNVYGLF